MMQSELLGDLKVNLAMVGQTAEWSYSGDTDPFKALCVPEQPKLSKYLPVLRS